MLNTTENISALNFLYNASENMVTKRLVCLSVSTLLVGFCLSVCLLNTPENIGE